MSGDGAPAAQGAALPEELVSPQVNVETPAQETGREVRDSPSTSSHRGNPDAFVYAIGKIETRFPSLGVEKEFAQVTGRSDSAGLTDTEALQAVVTDRTNRYLTRQLAWILTIESLETYLLVPRDPGDLDLLIESVRPTYQQEDIDVVVGVRGPLASPEMARGLIVPIVFFDQVYSFDTQSLIRAIPKPEGIAEDRFEAVAQEVFRRMVQIADNAGATDEHRALNFLVVRYPRIYEAAADAFGKNNSLSSVEVRTSELTGVRTVVDVIFNYTNRETDVVESFFVRVDVTEEFPFLVTKLSPYTRR